MIYLSLVVSLALISEILQNSNETNGWLCYVWHVAVVDVFQPISAYQVDASEVNDGEIAHLFGTNPATDFPDLNNGAYELAYVFPRFCRVYACTM